MFRILAALTITVLLAFVFWLCSANTPVQRHDRVRVTAGSSSGMEVRGGERARHVLVGRDRPALPEAGALSPEVPDCINGTILDATGGPIEGASVSVSDTAYPADQQAAGHRTVSRDDGTFNVGCIKGAAARLTVLASGYATWVRTYVLPITDLTIRLEPGGIVQGRILETETLAAIEGAVITLTSRGGDNRVRARATSGADGAFIVSGLPANVYSVLAESDRWAFPRERVFLSVGARRDVTLVGKPSGSLALTVLDHLDRPCKEGLASVKGPASALVPLGLPPTLLPGLAPGSYTLEVTCAGFAALLAVVEATGMPRQAVTVRLPSPIHISGFVQGKLMGTHHGPRVQVRNLMSGHESTCETAEGGSFTCNGLTNGEYECYVVSERTAKAVVVVADASVDGVELRLEEKTFGSLSVTASGSFEALFARLRDDTHRFHLEQRGERFEADNVPAGVYTLYVGSPSDPSAVTVAVGAGEVATVSFAPASEVLSGRVANEESIGLPDVRVALLPAEFEGLDDSVYPPVVSDADGKVVFDGLAAGRYRARLSTSDGRSVEREVLVPASELELVFPGQ